MVVVCRIMYRELKDSDKEKDGGKMVGHRVAEHLQGLNCPNDRLVD